MRACVRACIPGLGGYKRSMFLYFDVSADLITRFPSPRGSPFVCFVHREELYFTWQVGYLHIILRAVLLRCFIAVVTHWLCEMQPRMNENLTNKASFINFI